jgi:hypothetical protein
MHARVIAFAAAVLVGGTAFAAEPAKPPAHQQDQAQGQRVEIVLASADQADSSDANHQAQPAPRHARVARVTTCRCGDQQDQPDE